MELGEWIGGRIIENSDKRGSDNRGSTVPGYVWIPTHPNLTLLNYDI